MTGTFDAAHPHTQNTFPFLHFYPAKCKNPEGVFFKKV